MVFACKDCGQKFLTTSQYKHRESKHLHLDKWSSGTDNNVSWKVPDGLNPELLRLLERYNLGHRAILCLWRDGQLNSAIRDSARILELQDRLKEWL